MTITRPAQPFVQQPNLTEVVVIPDGTIRPVPGRQGISVLLGIGADSSGTQGLCLNIAEIPPGHREEAHWHIDSESALYMLPGSGRAVTYWGENLEQEVWTGPGDFLFFPPASGTWGSTHPARPPVLSWPAPTTGTSCVSAHLTYRSIWRISRSCRLSHVNHRQQPGGLAPGPPGPALTSVWPWLRCP